MLLCVLLATPALAQDEYVPPDKELWQQMVLAFGNVSMPLPAHQQVTQILQTVEREAKARAAKKEPAK